MFAVAMIAASGCSRMANLYPPPPPPQVGALSLVPSDLDFGAQQSKTASRTFVFVLTNPLNNDGTGVITEVATSGPPFEIDAGASTCAAKVTLPVGGHCQIGVKFAPTALGKQTGTVAITDNAANSPQVATLEGVGR